MSAMVFYWGACAGFVLGILVTVALTYRRPIVRGSAPFQVVSYADGMIQVWRTCTGREIGKTLREVVLTADWDRIVVEPSEEL